MESKSFPPQMVYFAFASINHTTEQEEYLQWCSSHMNKRWKYITTIGLALEVFYEVDFCELTSMINLVRKFLQSQHFLFYTKSRKMQCFWYCISDDETCEGAGHVQTFNFKALYTSTRLTYSIILSPHQAIKPHWKTSSLWSMVAIWKDNLGPPGYSLILVLYNNLRQRLCCRFNSSNVSKKESDLVKYMFA